MCKQIEFQEDNFGVPLCIEECPFYEYNDRPLCNHALADNDMQLGGYCYPQIARNIAALVLVLETWGEQDRETMLDAMDEVCHTRTKGRAMIGEFFSMKRMKEEKPNWPKTQLIKESDEHKYENTRG